MSDDRGLHFRITLAPKDEQFQDRLEEEIERRWPWREGFGTSTISTLTLEHGEETQIKIEGWPALRANIREHLTRQLAAWRAGRQNYFRTVAEDGYE